MAGFLLGFCFIDAAAGFHSGRLKEMQGRVKVDDSKISQSA